MNNHLTIKEYAKIAGVTEQAIYKRIRKTELANYVEVINNRKYINVKALDLIKAPEQINDEYIISEYDRTHYLEMIDILKAQVADQADQIRNKDQQINTLLEQNKQLTETLAITAENLKSAQVLHAGTLQAHLKTDIKDIDPDKTDQAEGTSQTDQNNKTDHESAPKEPETTGTASEIKENQDKSEPAEAEKTDSTEINTQETKRKPWYKRLLGL